MPPTDVETIPRANPLDAAPSRPSIWRRWPVRILLLIVVLWAASEGLSLAIQYTPLRRLLTSRIEATMGRPVEVGRYTFSFWNGPAIEARSVTVDEDPRFGAEYFLRADTMTIRLRWRSLLRGRFELGTLSLNRPSLNLVRNAAGDWNLAEWLPKPAAAPAPRGFSGPVLPSMTTHFRRVEVEGGRINFKLADEKLPFAFVGVAGTVETDRPGRWRLNLEASPWRAAVVLQQAGTLHISGEVGGTSSRLRPATLSIGWTDASLSDVLRLTRGDDFGVRGALALSIDARTDGDSDAWTLASRVVLRQLHRWDLALRPDNPSLSLIAQLGWSPAAPYVELTQAKIETPHSSAQASGRIYWGPDLTSSKRMILPPQVVSSSADIDAIDLLAWIRAFHAGVSDNVSLRGTMYVDTAFSGWPPRVVHADVSSNGVDLSGTALRKPIHIGLLELRDRSGLISSLPIDVSWGASLGPPDGSFRLEAPPKPAAFGSLSWHLAGRTDQLRDLSAAAFAFGWNIFHAWDLTGPFGCDLRWQARPDADFIGAIREPTGWMEFGAPGKASDGAALRAPFLNLPVEQINARVELAPGLRQLKLSSAEAFGARWSGTFERRNPSAPWHFNLSADRLSAADLDRWLNPRWRESFLDRMLPFLNSRSVASTVPEDLRAVGQLSVDRFALAPLAASHLQGDLEIDGRRIALTNASAQFYGGQVAGSLDANLQAAPSYHADLKFSRIDAAGLASTSPAMKDLFAGQASAQLSLETRGATRSDLIANLVCKGQARVLGPKLQSVGLGESLRDSTFRAGSSQFADADAAFTCADRSILFQKLDFVYVDTGISATGAIGFSGDLDLELEDYSAISRTFSNPTRVTGSLTAPKFARAASPPPRRSR